MATAPYVGNNDFRGYLSYLGQQGSPYAAAAIGSGGSQGFVDNNGNVNAGLLSNYVSSPADGSPSPAAQLAMGATEQDRINNFNSYLKNAYNAYQGYGGSVLGANTTAGGSTLDPSTLAAYNTAIANTQDAINRIPTQKTAAQSGIDSSYNAALQQLLLGKNQAQQSYTTTKQNTVKDYVGAKNTIGSQAGQTLNGLLRLLGSRGAGGGSAYTQAAPQAVARGASLQRAGVGQQFGQNSQALDQNWGQYLQGYQGSVDNAGFQKQQQYGALDNSVSTNQASLLQQLAQLTAARDGNTTNAQPLIDQANSLLDKTATYAPASFSVNPTPYTAPSLSSYTTTPQTPSYQGQTATNDYFSPYLQSLLGKKQLATG